MVNRDRYPITYDDLTRFRFYSNHCRFDAADKDEEFDDAVKKIKSD
jgi:hypothetical protein